MSDMRVLPLNGYDIILGADWIYVHSLIGLNLKTRQFSINKYGMRQVVFCDETQPTANCLIEVQQLNKLMSKGVIGAVIYAQEVSTSNVEQPEIPERLKPVLSEFQDIFSEPTTLPPPKNCDHAIPIVPGAKPVNQRPYRLPHYQKNAMEGLIEQLLKSEVIRTSVSPYSSPAILVKKKGGS